MQDDTSISNGQMMRMVSIEPWNLSADGRQEFMIQMINNEASTDRVQLVLLRVNNDGNIDAINLSEDQIY